MPPMTGCHLTSFESKESQGRDGLQVPSFVVQQPFNPESYYAQFYRSGADADGRMSPLHSTGVPTKYNGNVSMLSPQSFQESERSGVWIGAPGRDMSGLQANSFYNLPKGSQVAYTPTQAGHGMFTSVYQSAQPVTTGAIHPLCQQSQAVAGSGVDKMGPTAQINWPNNY